MAGRSRYTRTVSWRNRVALFALTVFTALPVSGTFCAAVCDSVAKKDHSHHGSGKSCEESSSSDIQLREATAHDCNAHDGAVLQAVAIAAARADAASATAPPPSAAAMPPTLRFLPDSSADFEYGPPSDSTPPSTAPLVLRV